jgi:2-polyprenyl-3-methyl-5-hydroxy-6-metoxy-1,4-benzoquinol methylase
MFRIFSDYEIADSSADHLNPTGTRQDDSFNGRFWYKLKKLLINFSLLDLGCSNGRLVKEIIDRGDVALGLEGSDYSRKMRGSYWSTLDKTFLFCQDITKKYQIFNINLSKRNIIETFKFDVITAFEVFEHIADKDWDAMLDNILAHSKPSTIYIFSISTDQSDPLHVTIKDFKSLDLFFNKKGIFFNSDLYNYFNSQYVRGPKINEPKSLIYVGTLNNFNDIKIPKLSLKDLVVDYYYYSKLNKFLNKITNFPR